MANGGKRNKITAATLAAAMILRALSPLIDSERSWRDRGLALLANDRLAALLAGVAMLIAAFGLWSQWGIDPEMVAAVEAGILAVAAALRDVLTQPPLALDDHEEPAELAASEAGEE